jgi:peptidyl-prolyl cis-trans isomerase A (cyclophilin A)
MKSILLCCTLSVSLFAQAPAAKPPVRRPAGGGGSGSLLNPSSLKATAPPVFQALFTTTKGDFTIEVHRDWSPHGADRFYNLVKSGFFDGVTFFRVHPGFMVQFGISSKPAVSKAWATANIPDDPVVGSNKRGYITYAMSSLPNSRTTQVFINFVDNTFLDSQRFAPFGQVTSGMDVVDKLYSGYGEIPAMNGTGPDPGKIETEGKAYLDKSFPQLDSIKTAKIVSPAPATPAAPAKK